MKRYRRFWILIALSILTIFALIRLGNIDVSWNTLNRVHLGWYLMVVVAYYASVVARGWRWYFILKVMGRPVGFVYATALLTAGLFANAILPARAGEVARIALLKQDHKIPVSQSLASIASERALDVFAILTMAIVAAWVALPDRIPPEAFQLMLITGALFIIGLIGLFVIPGIETWLREGKLIQTIIPQKIWPFYQKILDFGFSLIHGVHLLGKQPLALIIAIGQSFFIWIWDALMVHFILISLNLKPLFSASLFSAMISDLVTAVPLTPGSLGQFDAVLVGLLTLFGYSVSDSSLTTLLLRLVQMWTFVPVSAIVTYIFGFSRILQIKNLQDDITQTPSVSAPPVSNPAEG